MLTSIQDGFRSDLKVPKTWNTHLKMVCTNPDIIVHRGNKQEYCAGKLAQIFKSIGGTVVYFGKPYPEIYKFCIMFRVFRKRRFTCMGAQLACFFNIFVCVSFVFVFLRTPRK